MKTTPLLIPSWILAAALLGGGAGCDRAAKEAPAATAARSTATTPPAPPPKPNQPPEFPKEVKIETTTQYKYDDAGRVMGSATIIELKTPATDPDGDSISYEWSGYSVDHTKFSTGDNSKIKFPSDLKAEGLKVEWTRVIIMGEPASGIITVKALDGKGGEAEHRIAVGRYVR